MAEEAPKLANAKTGEALTTALSPAQLDRLTELVLGLFKQETLRGHERRGNTTSRDWR
jgi:hypothetical protein